MPADDITVITSSRDPEDLRRRLQAWLIERTTDPNVTVGAVSSPSANGMSSESLFFDATWNGSSGSFVARLAPAPDDVPVFSSYDLEMQYRVIDLVARHSAVPVPTLCWLERDPAALGVPFFVMERVAGRVPPDLPPYAMGGWIVELGPEGLADLERESVAVLGNIHAIDITAIDASFLEFERPGATPLCRHVEAQREFYRWVCAGAERSFPAIERSFDWIDANWPEEQRATISWGDARIGNIMYDDHSTRPTAVLDWEMAGIAPPGVDVGWMCFMHRFFEHVLQRSGIETLPDMFDPAAVRSTYLDLTGRDVGDLRWEMAYAGLRHAILMSRHRVRSVHFGTEIWPDDPDDAFLFKDLLGELTAD